jgi:5-formyltetrahydrofolate cyclo-ligase
MENLEYLDLNELPNNCFLIIRVDVVGPMEKYAASQNIAKTLTSHIDVLKKKKISLMIMTPKEKFEILTEQEMNQAGWFRKN